ncbi:TetR/AcrR family transcriptional regulator [Arthrobacter sp. NA-172]|uniref:TetR/AcrR family transcriptional regulator n=1 Tax=Arthrobacter sp. NA-172 TaxID=3367524 RepID=UPI0037545984
MEAASAKFAESGYHRTPMSRIAEDVGLTQGGLMHHFPSKQHLLIAVAERRLLNTARWWEELGEDLDGLEAFREIVRSTERLLAEPGLIELFVVVSAQAADADSPAKHLYAEWYERAIAGVESRLVQAAAAGHLKSGRDYRAIAEECIAVSDGLQLQWVISDGKLDLVGRVRAFAERLAEDLSVDTAHRA